MSRAAHLYQLQKLDDEYEGGRRRLSQIAAALGETDTLRRARQAVQKADAWVKQWTVKQLDGELEIEGIKEEIDSSEKRLYGGSVRNPKELGDLQAKVFSLRRLLEQKEDQLLEIMMTLEEAEAAQESAHLCLQQAKADWQRAQSTLQAEKSELENQLAAAERGRQALLDHISPDDLAIYRSLRKAKGGVAVAVMLNKACTACGMEVPQGRISRGLEAGFLTCGNCERILVPDQEKSHALPS
ncbi:MAG: hypothetical protein JW900_03650 [Anaerolineae bacterium]|nr:hypothetical protein [Anaerolineae bacterium]